MKPEVVFGLENATWPVLLVNPAGLVLLTNGAAKNVLGAALNGTAAQLAAVWATENQGNPEDFLRLWLQSPLPVKALKFKTASGTTATFTTALSQFNHDGKPAIIMQLLSGAGGIEPAPDAKPVTEGDAALKQKLDCVLQLARSVSLDFNNALTGVLAHTSLLLGKAELDHPWRRALLEVEKSAARAAEIAGGLALFRRQG